MTRRMWLTVLALVGLFIASYLALYHYGYIGQLACTATHGCETVQTSRWAKQFGLPVALWGVAYYALVFSLTLLGIQDRFAESRELSLTILILTGWGAVYSLWLTYLEG